MSPRSSERSSQNYLQAFQRAGFEAVPLDTDDNSLLDTLDGLEAIALSGGGDIAPARYGEDPTPELKSVDEQRDSFELELFERSLARELPILAICRGHQVVNVALGGRLIQYIENELHHTPKVDPGANSGWHPVKILAGSRLHEVYGSERITTNSRHHQGIRDDILGKHLKATAWSEDGYVEGFESDLGGGVIGVQWHPERVEAGQRDGFNEQSRLLFGYFKHQVEARTALVRK